MNCVDKSTSYFLRGKSMNIIDEIKPDSFTEQEWHDLQSELERIRLLPAMKAYEGCNEHSCLFHHSCN